MPFYGAAIVCLDDDNVQQILPNVNRRIITYGMGAQAMLVIPTRRAVICPARFGFDSADTDLGEFHLDVPGVHNVQKCYCRDRRSVWSWASLPM